MTAVVKYDSVPSSAYNCPTSGKLARFRNGWEIESLCLGNDPLWCCVQLTSEDPNKYAWKQERPSVPSSPLFNMSLPVPQLFQPVSVGEMQLKHRIVMAPLTRYSSDSDRVPLKLVKEYYVQRASQPGTLIISEAMFIDERAAGYPHAPGLWSKAHIAAWKEIVDAVHAQGSFIYMQLWAHGRAAQPATLGKNAHVSASDIPLSYRPADEIKPRPLSTTEIAEYLELYARAAKYAVEDAGFDGVEVHGANGYLIDQFTQDVSNVRSDEYGGSIENRTRFALEVIDAVVAAVGPKKTGFRISPWNNYQDMRMKDPKPTFSYLLEQIKARHPDLAFIHAVEPRSVGEDVLDDDTLSEDISNDFIREIWASESRRLISAGGYKRDSAILDGEKGELIAFGRLFIANPDLASRLMHDYPLNPYDRDTFYLDGVSDPRGFTDYPFYAPETQLP
ncbi:unnamed protein product [Mycena citricolor]|uniref:NADH:flavin oxidoreductase/NADH oxidase N-terminal domain-containing protein n=1 Tax=Mycena citricolor TaxID=2018698 RepID=A0AAD2JUQ2_9AGAR|nr:unnamed protein product [Mycena citricolor]